MPIRFTVDPQLKTLFTTAEGIVSFEDVQQHIDRLAADGLLEYRKLFNAYNASTNATGDQARRIVSRLKLLAHDNDIGPAAVVANQDVFFGMAMMVKILCELQGGPEVEVFRDLDAARDWLVRK